MLDIAWPEIVVIGAVALVAIGPKDLPKVMHKMGQWAGKARRFMQDIQHSFEQLSYEAEIAEKMKQAEHAESLKSRSPVDAPVASAEHKTDHDQHQPS